MTFFTIDEYLREHACARLRVGGCTLVRACAHITQVGREVAGIPPISKVVRVLWRQADPNKPLQDAIVYELPVQPVRLLSAVVRSAVRHAHHLSSQLATYLHAVEGAQERGTAKVSPCLEARGHQAKAQNIAREKVSLKRPTILKTAYSNTRIVQQTSAQPHQHTRGMRCSLRACAASI